MAEQRKKYASVCVLHGANGKSSIELFRASEWGGAPDMYRVRVEREWIGGTRKDKRLYTPQEVGELLARQIFADNLRDTERKEAAPDMPRNLRVSAPCGVERREQTYIVTETPFRGADGRWYVGCYLVGRGVVMIPVEDIVVKKYQPAAGRKEEA